MLGLFGVALSIRRAVKKEEEKRDFMRYRRAVNAFSYIRLWCERLLIFLARALEASPGSMAEADAAPTCAFYAHSKLPRTRTFGLWNIHEFRKFETAQNSPALPASVPNAPALIAVLLIEMKSCSVRLGGTKQISSSCRPGILDFDDLHRH